MAKIDWLAAQRDYIADQTASYESIAEKYGVSKTAVAEVARKYNWVAAKEQALSKAVQKLHDNLPDRIAKFQEEKLSIGKFLVGVGVKGIQEKPPRTAREAREILDSGYRISTEAMGLDKPQTQVNVQNTTLSMHDFVAQMQKRREERGQP